MLMTILNVELVDESVLIHFYCLTIEIATVYAQSRETNYCTEKNYIKAEATLTKNAGMNAI